MHPPAVPPQKFTAGAAKSTKLLPCLTDRPRTVCSHLVLQWLNRSLVFRATWLWLVCGWELASRCLQRRGAELVLECPEVDPHSTLRPWPLLAPPGPDPHPRLRHHILPPVSLSTPPCHSHHQLHLSLPRVPLLGRVGWRPRSLTSLTPSLATSPSLRSAETSSRALAPTPGTPGGPPGSEPTTQSVHSSPCSLSPPTCWITSRRSSRRRNSSPSPIISSGLSPST